MLPYPHIDPIAVRLGPLAVHWYGLAYVAAFLVGQKVMTWVCKRHPAFDVALLDKLFLGVVIGVVLGGRLGYVLFYNPGFYFANPLEAFKVWQGGMSYHGGMLGVFTAILYVAWQEKIHYFDITDRLAPAVPVGLFFGRMANFINGELFGKVTHVPWAMVFPLGGPLPRHPSQLYEAGLEGVLLFIVLITVARVRVKRFELSGLFMLGYGLCRFMVEFVREPDPIPHLHHGIFTVISMGQLLSLPMVFIGLGLLWVSYAKR